MRWRPRKLFERGAMGARVAPRALGRRAPRARGSSSEHCVEASVRADLRRGERRRRREAPIELELKRKRETLRGEVCHQPSTSDFFFHFRVFSNISMFTKRTRARARARASGSSAPEARTNSIEDKDDGARGRGRGTRPGRNRVGFPCGALFSSLAPPFLFFRVFYFPLISLSLSISPSLFPFFPLLCTVFEMRERMNAFGDVSDSGDSRRM